MKILPSFIVIDDDKFNNALCKMVIGKIRPEAGVLAFHNPIEGIDHIISTYYQYTIDQPVILLLDINMPEMNGWEFLDIINKFLQQQKEPLTGKLFIYVLSSSVDKKDIDSAIQYANVIDYIIKPITKDIIIKILDQIFN